MATVKAYGIPHKRFLQGMMCRKICNAGQVRELFNVCFLEKPVSFGENIAAFISVLNSRISRFHMEIRKGIDERDGKHSYCLINCQESTLSLLASDYTPAELQYVQNLIMAIVRSTNGSVSSIDAINLTISLAKPMQVSEVDKLLKRLKANKWLVETKHGEIALSTLAILEFDRYIKEMFPEDVTLCRLCKQLVVSGEICAECNMKFHRHCACRASLKACPRCSTPWHNRTGTTAVDADDSTQRTATQSGRVKRRKR